VDPEPLHDFTALALDSLRAELELARNRARPVALRHRAQDLDLTPGELLEPAADGDGNRDGVRNT